jgi:hypothetical protein
LSKLAPGFHIFGTGKLFVRSLVVYQCVLKTDLDQSTKLVSIERTHKELNGSYRQEASTMDYAIFPRGNTFHLHDLFLTESFGLTVRFLDGNGQFETFDLKSNIEASPHLLFRSLFEDEELRLVSYVEAKPIK